MKPKGVNNKFEFILLQDTPVFNLKGKDIKEKDDYLLEGTVIKGSLKTRIINNEDGLSKPYKIIELEDVSGFIFPELVNFYISDFVNVDGNKNKEETPIQETALGELKNNKKTSNKFISFGLPIVGGLVGYGIAKKMDADVKKKIGLIAFFSLMGMIPKYIYSK